MNELNETLVAWEENRDYQRYLGVQVPPMTLIKLDCRPICDWDTFHETFVEIFGFPASYGRNMNAWIDCMTYLDEPQAGMSVVSVEPGSVLVLQLDRVDDFAVLCPEQFIALVDCAAFVNWRRIEQGQSAVFALSYHRSNQKCQNPLAVDFV